MMAIRDTEPMLQSKPAALLTRIWSLVEKEFIHLRRDWFVPAFMLLGGALELLLIGWATSRPITNLPLMVLDQDRTPASRELLVAMENTTTFSVSYYADNLLEIEDALARGRINAAIIIPQGYAEQIILPNGNPTYALLLNGAESTAATAAQRSLAGVSRTINDQLVVDRLGLPPATFSSFSPSVRVWFNESLSEALYTTPAEMALMLEFTVLIFAALAFARERELGTLEQLLVMPFRTGEIIIGKSIPALLVGFLDLLIMLPLVHFAFKVPLRGSLGLLLLLALGYLIVELGKGLVISVIARTQHQAFLLVMLVGMVDFMFTGYAAPVDSMPALLQWIANLVPAHHWLAIVRGIMLKGVGLEILWPHVAALAALGVVIMTFSIRFVRRALD